MPEKIDEKNSFGIIWKVHAYDVNQHSAIRGLLRRMHADMTKKAPRPVASQSTTRQQSIVELPAFVVTVTQRAPTSAV